VVYLYKLYNNNNNNTVDRTVAVFDIVRSQFLWSPHIPLFFAVFIAYLVLGSVWFVVRDLLIAVSFINLISDNVKG
jgi:hypothetical protein